MPVQQWDSAASRALTGAIFRELTVRSQMELIQLSPLPSAAELHFGNVVELSFQIRDSLTGKIVTSGPVGLADAVLSLKRGFATQKPKVRQP